MPTPEDELKANQQEMDRMIATERQLQAEVHNLKQEIRIKDGLIEKYSEAAKRAVEILNDD